MMLDTIKRFLNAIVGGVLPDVLGKGPGFVGFGITQAFLITYLLKSGVDGAAIGMAFGPVNLGLYGAGSWKAHSDNTVIVAQAQAEMRKNEAPKG